MWTLDSTRIFVTEQTSNNKNIIARLQPLSGGTIYQRFGYETEVQTLQAVVVGDTDIEALKAMSRSGSSYALSRPEGSIGNVYVNNVSIKRLPSISQTLRPDLDCDAPVYSVTIEVYL